MAANESTRSKLVEEIEHLTGQTVAIDTAETDDVLAKCNPQDQSPLFSLLPREIRDLIWSFATEQAEDKTKPYEKNKYYYRPGHTAKLKTDYNVLLTCRRVWLEAHALPMLQAEHSFWYHRPAPDARSKEWMGSLTALNRKYFGTLHLYAQMCNIEGLRADEGCLRDYFLLQPQRCTEDFQPSTFHVTIRHTDWWYWESETPLRFEYDWFQAMLDSPDLRRTENIKLELETLDYKVPQLNPIVEHIKALQSKEFDTHIVNGKPTSTKFVLQDNVEITSWTGPTKIEGRTFGQYQDKTELKYHVITLTWRLKFPQYPKAHIPHLRLSAPSDTTGAVGLGGHGDYYSNHRRRSSDSFLESTHDRIRDFELGIPEPAPRGKYSYVRHISKKRRRFMEMIRTSKSNGEFSSDDGDDEVLEEKILMGTQNYVLVMGAWQSRVTEWMRSRMFWKEMQPARATEWEGRFLKEKNLLKLEEKQV